jgi:hypothetical protein
MSDHVPFHLNLPAVFVIIWVVAIAVRGIAKIVAPRRTPSMSGAPAPASRAPTSAQVTAAAAARSVGPPTVAAARSSYPPPTTPQRGAPSPPPPPFPKPPARPPSALTAALRDPARVRTAVILAEVLGPPLALR